MTSITISDESTLGEKRAWRLDFLDETITLRELIRRRVYQEVIEYNARQAGVYRGLVQPTDAERVLNGYQLKTSRRLDWEAQYDKAIKDFARRSYWQSYSFGDLSATAETRKQILTRLVPRLTIGDRCTIEGRFLRVRGDLRTYKIHPGSGNILMEPNDQYLCIVPGRGSSSSATEQLFLPFEGDSVLAVILSKAFLLADDRKISDPTIMRQIGVA